MTRDLDKLYLRYATDPTALDSLLEGVRLYALKVADRYTPDPEDAAQEVTVKTWKAMSSFGRRSSFQTFVHAIALHHLMDGKRKAARRIQITPIAEPQEQAQEEPKAERFSLARFQDDDKIILHTLAKHMSFAKAAEELGVSPKALRSRLERLKARSQKINLQAA